MNQTNQGDMAAQLAAAQAELAAMKAKAAKASRITFKVSPKGAVSVYGLGRFPVTLYGEQWTRLLEQGNVESLRAFIEQNDRFLNHKGE
jgi:hypothetical protein